VVSFSASGRSAVFVISIPDWGITPFGQLKKPEVPAIEIGAFNARLHYIDITPGSRLAENDESLIAVDGCILRGKCMPDGYTINPLVKRYCIKEKS